MKEITLDQFLENESIFSRIQNLAPLPIFDKMTPLNMDKHLSMFYGERIIYNRVIGLDLNTLVELIVSSNIDKWNDLIKVNELDIINGAERTVNENNTSTSLNTGSNNRTHKVSAFNDPELLPESGDTDSTTNTADNNGTRLLTEKSKSMQTAFNNLQLKQKLNIIETVVKDVANYMTLSVY